MSLDLTTSYSCSWIYFFNSLKLEQIAIGKLLSYEPPKECYNQDDMFLSLVLFKANVKKTCYSSIVPLY